MRAISFHCITFLGGMGGRRNKTYWEALVSTKLIGCLAWKIKKYKKGNSLFEWSFGCCLFSGNCSEKINDEWALALFLWQVWIVDYCPTWAMVNPVLLWGLDTNISHQAGKRSPTAEEKESPLFTRTHSIHFWLLESPLKCYSWPF